LKKLEGELQAIWRVSGYDIFTRGIDGSQMIGGDGFKRRIGCFNIKIGNDLRWIDGFVRQWLCGKGRNIGDAKRHDRQNEDFSHASFPSSNSILAIISSRARNRSLSIGISFQTAVPAAFKNSLLTTGVSVPAVPEGRSTGTLWVTAGMESISITSSTSNTSISGVMLSSANGLSAAMAGAFWRRYSFLLRIFFLPKSDMIYHIPQHQADYKKPLALLIE
jgi:hypothetical protein